MTKTHSRCIVFIETSTSVVRKTTPNQNGEHMLKTLQIRLLGDPILRKIAKPVKFPRHGLIRKFCARMKHTLLQSDAVGLAAPQVGQSLRIIMVGLKPSKRRPDCPVGELYVMINPQIITKSTRMMNGMEGCMSLPGLADTKVPRHARVRVRWTTQDGELRTQWFGGLLARVIQHEVDHLDGIFYTDRTKDNSSLMAWPEYEKLLAAKRRAGRK